MLRVMIAGIAAVAIGTVGGLTLGAATPVRDAAPQAQLAMITGAEIVAPKETGSVPVPVATEGDDALDKVVAAARPGPVVARESLGTEAVASPVTVGSGQPTRATGSVAGRPAPSPRRSYAAYGPAGHPLMLGVGY
jgi:hypothetical protein